MCQDLCSASWSVSNTSIVSVYMCVKIWVKDWGFSSQAPYRACPESEREPTPPPQQILHLSSCLGEARSYLGIAWRADPGESPRGLGVAMGAHPAEIPGRTVPGFSPPATHRFSSLALKTLLGKKESTSGLLLGLSPSRLGLWTRPS